MKFEFDIDPQSIIPIYQQIQDYIISAIDSGKVQQGDKMPSINMVCKHYSLAPGTVIKAYEELREKGIIASRQGKGFFIASTDTKNKLKVFLLFDRLNAYKEELYYSFLHALGGDTEADVYFHHYDVKRFQKLVEENLGLYHYYVVMPHFHENVAPIVQQIPTEKLLVMDNRLPSLEGEFAEVAQYFEEDLYKALKEGKSLLSKYQNINMLLSKDHFQFVPGGLVNSFSRFCEEAAFPYRIVEQASDIVVQPKEAFLVFHDSDLIYLIKLAQAKGYKLGKDIGIVSYDDTPMKEILAEGITVATTDFKQMGIAAAEMILHNRHEKIHNPFFLIKRKSL
jgi:DNA-binding transcriptional regulator YhcF (GntR family)